MTRPFAVSLLILFVACTFALADEQQATKNATELSPLSDPSNSGGWVLNEAISDEFSGDTLDHSKWFVQGENGDYYIWKGRAPSQFAAHNVRVEDGMLKLRSQWEPDFGFAQEDYAGGTYGDKVAPVTTAGVITRKRFLYGYMETRSKAGNAAMTSSFWLIGHQSELDIYEQMGNPKEGTHTMEDDFLFTVHDWRPGRFQAEVGNNKTFTHKHKTGFRVADDFHVYACDWGPEHLKFYLDGKLVHETTKQAVIDDGGWVLTNPMEIWFDSEIFRWMGYPDAAELPVDFEIDYCRVWQKPNANLLDTAFFGFEGPILYEDNPKPLDLTPETDSENDYQKFWRIPDSSNFSIVEEKFDGGIKSLKFDASIETIGDAASVSSPAGSVNLPAGDFQVSLRVWIEPSSSVQTVRISLDDPQFEIQPFDVRAMEQGKWLRLTQQFTRATASAADDHMTMRIQRDDLANDTSVIYIDDISIERKLE